MRFIYLTLCIILTAIVFLDFSKSNYLLGTLDIIFSICWYKNYMMECELNKALKEWDVSR